MASVPWSLRKKDNGVFELAICFQSIHQRTDRIIQREHHFSARIRIGVGFFQETSFSGAGRDRVSLGREELGTSRGPKGVRVGSLLQERVSSSGPFGRVVAR